MNRLLLMFAFIFLATGSAGALTYSWTDNTGVIHFTDSPETIPPQYMHRVVTRDDITIRDPKIRDEVLRDNEREQNEEMTSATTRELTPTPPPQQPVTPPASPEVKPAVTPPAPIWNLCAPGQPLTVACAPGPLPKKSDKTS